jgi:hypothetical protein
MTDEMYTHENSTYEFRCGYWEDREGLEKSIELTKELIQDLKNDCKIEQALWVEVVRDWLENEHSFYEVGDEE